MATVQDSLQLYMGDRVAIVGGGPAGSFFALHLLKYATEHNLMLDVRIFESRKLTGSGPQTCAKCAGLLSAGLQNNLRAFGLHLPEHLIQTNAKSYVLHLAGAEVEISPPIPNRKIISVYRGNGPRLSSPNESINFDQWLLRHAQLAGATVVAETVKRISFSPLPTIETVFSVNEFELVVLATGVNGRRIEIEGVPYQPPKTEAMIQDELADFPRQNRRVHVYFSPEHGIIFGATVPKGDFVNISLLGSPSKMQLADTFLEHVKIPPKYRRMCGCKPNIAVSPAKNFYADRFVAVGDAAATRLYKDGIGSAFRTAKAAAQTATLCGISAASFKKNYAPLCKSIHRDNFWGRVLFFLWEITGKSSALTHLWLSALTPRTAAEDAVRIYRLALWNMFTGDESYGRILRSLLHPRVIWFLLKQLPQSWRYRTQSLPSEES